MHPKTKKNILPALCNSISFNGWDRIGIMSLSGIYIQRSAWREQADITWARVLERVNDVVEIRDSFFNRVKSSKAVPFDVFRVRFSGVHQGNVDVAERLVSGRGCLYSAYA